MRPRHVLLLIVLFICSAAAANGAGPREQIANPEKAFVTDGHVVHNLGRLHNHVTNWGLIGSHPGTGTPYAAAPSARWPGETGVDYLWGAGLWVGGEVLGERLVSTGQFSTELMPSTAPSDTIYPTHRGAAGGNRYPWDGADDDSDGSEDEDPLDGLDNDGDGLIDEDFAAISDQDFHCTMTDTTALAQDVYPDHTPLNIRVTQRSFQWGDPLAADFIGYEFTITNIGVVPIENLRCGLFSDFDIGAADDDLAGSWHDGLVQVSDGSFVETNLAYMRDHSAIPAPGWAGWVMCGATFDGMFVRPEDTLIGLRIFSGQASYDQGGDPTNDAERYQALGTQTWDPDVPGGQAADYRVLLTVPDLGNLAPGASAVLRLALVLGAGLDELLPSSAEAVRTALGGAYDRDGDPSNGAEFHVPWMRPGDDPSAVMPDQLTPALVLSAAPNPFNPRVTFSFTLTEPQVATLSIHDIRGRKVRTLMSNRRVAGTARVAWDGTDAAGQPVASGVYFGRLVVGQDIVRQRVSLVR